MCAEDLHRMTFRNEVKRTHCRRYLYDQGLRKGFLSKSLEVQTKDKQLIILCSVKDMTKSTNKTGIKIIFAIFRSTYKYLEYISTIYKSARNTNRKMGKGYKQEIHKSTNMPRNAKWIYSEILPCTHQNEYKCLANRKVDNTECYQGCTETENPQGPLWGIKLLPPCRQTICQDSLRERTPIYGPASPYLALYSRCKELHVHEVTWMGFECSVRKKM